MTMHLSKFIELYNSQERVFTYANFKNHLGGRGNPKMKHKLWQKNPKVLQAYQTTSLKGMGEDVLT